MYCNHIEQPSTGSLSLQGTWHCVGTAEPCTIIAISTGGERIATAGLEVINIFNVVEMFILERSFIFSKKQNEPHTCKSLCFSHCGCYLLSYHSDPNLLYIWDLVKGTEAKRIKIELQVGQIHALPIPDISVFTFLGFLGTDHVRSIYWFDWQTGHIQPYHNAKGHFTKTNTPSQSTNKSYSNLLSVFTVLSDRRGGCDVYLLDHPSSGGSGSNSTHLLHYKLSPPPPPSNITIKRQQLHLYWVYELQKHRTYTLSIDIITVHATRMIALPASSSNHDAKLAVNINTRTIWIFSLNRDKDPITVLRALELPALNTVIISLFALPAIPDQYDPTVTTDTTTSSSVETSAIGIIASEVVNGLSTIIMKPKDRCWQKTSIPPQLKSIYSTFSPSMSGSISNLSGMNRLQLVCLEHTKKLWICRRAITSSFAGAMFPVGYRLVRTSCSYEEQEDEFDRVISDSSSSPAGAMDVVIPARQPLDCSSAPLTLGEWSFTIPLQLLDNGLVNKGQQQYKNQAQEGRTRSNLQAWARRQRSLREGKVTDDTICSRFTSPVKKQPLGYNPFAVSLTMPVVNNNSSSTATAAAAAEADEKQVLSPRSQPLHWTVEMILPPPSNRLLEQLQANAFASRPILQQPGTATTNGATNSTTSLMQNAKKHVENVRFAALDRLVKNEMSAFTKRMKARERVEKKRIGKELAMKQLMSSAAAPPPPPRPSPSSNAVVPAVNFDEALRLFTQLKQQQGESVPQGAEDVRIRMEVGDVLYGLLTQIEK